MCRTPEGRAMGEIAKSAVEHAASHDKELAITKRATADAESRAALAHETIQKIAPHVEELERASLEAQLEAEELRHEKRERQRKRIAKIADERVEILEKVAATMTQLAETLASE